MSDEYLARWLRKAERDLQVADNEMHTVTGNVVTEAVCFHAQQAVEKYLKALLVHGRIHFRRVHDIRALVALLPQSLRPAIPDSDQALLTSYAITVRYPGESGEDEPTIGEARAAVGIARRVRAQVRRCLPKGVLS